MSVANKDDIHDAGPVDKDSQLPSGLPGKAGEGFKNFGVDYFLWAWFRSGKTLQAADLTGLQAGGLALDFCDYVSPSG
ncbi:MAG: hypothetical protein ACC669_02975 [bacterium]